MKIVKERKVVKEEIVVQQGIYYFTVDLRNYKMVVKETDEDGYTQYILETLNNFANRCSITVDEDEAIEERCPYIFKQFILGEEGSKITQDEYEEQRIEVLKRISQYEINNTH